MNALGPCLRQLCAHTWDIEAFVPASPAFFSAQSWVHCPTDASCIARGVS